MFLVLHSQEGFSRLHYLTLYTLVKLERKRKFTECFENYLY